MVCSVTKADEDIYIFGNVLPLQLLGENIPIALKEWLLSKLLFFVVQFRALSFPCAALEVRKAAFPKQFLSALLT